MADGISPDPCADQILALENLHTLKRLRAFTCSERMLELIPSLKKLGIIYWSFDTFLIGWSKFSLNNLVHLHKLEKLNFYTDPCAFGQSNLSQNIAFPVTLKKLTLTGTESPWDDMSIVGSLPSLQVLKLKYRACRGIVWETAEGEFCQLKVLLIDDTGPYLWTTESSHFPKLERLRLHNCKSLGEIPDSIGEIPTLQLIEVHWCNSFLEESATRTQEEQHIFGNDLQVLLETSFDQYKDLQNLDMTPFWNSWSEVEESFSGLEMETQEKDGS